MNLSRAKSMLPLAAFIWLISPSFYWLWQARAPVETTILPPLQLGERVMLAPYLILEQLGYWLWPMGREPLTFTLEPTAIFREGLFYWLILVLVIRFSGRLRRVEPWIFIGMVLSILALVPFSGLVPSLVVPFDAFPMLFAGVGLSITLAVLLGRAAQTWRDTEPGRQGQLRRLAWRTVGLLIIAWMGLQSVNLIATMGRTWEQRLASQTTDSPDLIIAVEIARLEGAQGKGIEAEALIIRCGQVAPWYAEVPVVKAELLLARGQTAAARVHLEQALQLDPQHAHAKKLLDEI